MEKMASEDATIETEVTGSEGIWKPQAVPRFPHGEEGSAVCRGRKKMEEACHEHTMKAHT